MSNNNTILTPNTNLVSNTTQKSGAILCTEYNTYHIDQNWNICTLLIIWKTLLKSAEYQYFGIIWGM